MRGGGGRGYSALAGRRLLWCRCISALAGGKYPGVKKGAKSSLYTVQLLMRTSSIMVQRGIRKPAKQHCQATTY
jgi:hypothetical protein